MPAANRVGRPVGKENILRKWFLYNETFYISLQYQESGEWTNFLTLYY